MLKVLFVCSQGITSAIAVNELKKAADKEGIKMVVLAVSTQEFEDEIKNGYDIAMIAPQVRHRFDYLKKHAKNFDTPFALIEPQGYRQLGGTKLLEQVKEILKL